MATVTVRGINGTAATGRVRLCMRHSIATHADCSGLTLVDGTAVELIRAAANTVVDASYAGDGPLLASRSRTIGFSVRPLVTVRGASRALTISVAPASGQRLTVQRLVSRRWLTVRPQIVRSERPWTLGTLSPGRYRVVVAAGGATLAATSVTVIVRS